jgi:hypothetical protein
MNPAAPVTTIGAGISNNILSYKKQIRVAERVYRLLPQLGRLNTKPRLSNILATASASKKRADR